MSTVNNLRLREAARRGTTLWLLTILWLSGALWLGLRWLPEPLQFIQERVDILLLQAWMMRLHGLAAMLCLIILGVLWQPHIRTAWRRQLNRRSGIPLLAGLVLLGSSGYGIYYFTGDWRGWNQYLHWAVGLALPLLIFWHLPQRHHD